MRRLLIATFALLIASPVFAQTADESTAKPLDPLTDTKWIGFMEGTDHRGLHVMPITATLTFTKDGTLTGRWEATSAQHVHAGGDVTGTIDRQGNVKATISIFTGAAMPDGVTVMDPERCSATAKVTGGLLYTGVFRWTAPRADFDTLAKRAHGRDCEDVTKVVWTLQPVDTK